MLKLLTLGVFSFVLSLFAVSVVHGQTATPTPTTAATPTVSPTTTTTTATPTPTGSVQGTSTTVPSGAPATGRAQ